MVEGSGAIRGPRCAWCTSIHGVYLMFVDESGTHGGSPVFVLGGIAIHEHDAPKLQARLEAVVAKVALGQSSELELHASEMRNAKKPDPGKASPWAALPRAARLSALSEAYQALVEFEPSNIALPVHLFAVTLDARFRAGYEQRSREQFAYEVLLKKFDDMLRWCGVPNRGLVIHDRRVVERDIQSWAAHWRVAAGSVGQLLNFADVPLFSDSKASRLIQAADLVSHAVFRNYASQSESGSSDFDRLWPRFHRHAGAQHGCVHFTPDFGQGTCPCRPCSLRLVSEAVTRRT